MLRIATICGLVLLTFALPARAQFAHLLDGLSASAAPVVAARPHPAVARIVVPEIDGTSFGSGTLVDVRDGYGLVLTNWHVVQGASDTVEVIFPDGFRSQARALKVDSEWDLAALVIWKPNAEPVTIATRPPRPGDPLTICGYGSGDYRAVTGRCTQYYAPRLDLPRELVELDVEARQGDSGGPIFNDRGELAGVLFGAGEGTTLGSFEGRVRTFLASLAPDIGGRSGSPPTMLANQDISPGVPEQRDLGDIPLGRQTVAEHTPKPLPIGELAPAKPIAQWASRQEELRTESSWPEIEPPPAPQIGVPTVEATPIETAPLANVPTPWLDHGRNILALVGALAIAVQLIKFAC